MPKPTIHELEEMLDDPSVEITILPNGTLVKTMLEPGEQKPVTFREKDMGGEYADLTPDQKAFLGSSTYSDHIGGLTAGERARLLMGDWSK